MDDREALLRLRDHLEQLPRPAGLLARERHAADLDRLRSVLEWDAERDDEPGALRSVQRRWAAGTVLLWASAIGWALLFPDDPRTGAEVLRLVGTSGVAAALSAWAAARFAGRIWSGHERRHVQFVERARALAAPAAAPGQDGPALPPASG